MANESSSATSEDNQIFMKQELELEPKVLIKEEVDPFDTDQFDLATENHRGEKRKYEDDTYTESMGPTNAEIMEKLNDVEIKMAAMDEKLDRITNLLIASLSQKQTKPKIGISPSPVITKDVMPNSVLSKKMESWEDIESLENVAQERPEFLHNEFRVFPDIRSYLGAKGSFEFWGHTVATAESLESRAPAFFKLLTEYFGTVDDILTLGGIKKAVSDIRIHFRRSRGNVKTNVDRRKKRSEAGENRTRNLSEER